MITLKITGAKEISDKLKALPAKFANGIIRRALRAGAKIILRQAKNNAPTRSGALRRSLKVKSGKRRKGYISLYVSTENGDYAGDQFYAAFQEFGWKHGKRSLGNKRKQVQGRHFIENAYKTHGQQALDTIISTMKQGLEGDIK